MFSNSVISKTQQMWKLWFGVIAMAVGSIAPAFEQTGLSWTTGTVIAVVGYGFSLAFISCPACGQRWLFKALLDAGMYGPLFRRSSCPSCDHGFD
jgi:hypothetical protein